MSPREATKELATREVDEESDHVVATSMAAVAASETKMCEESLQPSITNNCNSADSIHREL